MLKNSRRKNDFVNILQVTPNHILVFNGSKHKQKFKIENALSKKRYYIGHILTFF